MTGASDGHNLVSDGANLVSDGVNLVSDGVNLVSDGANPVSDGANPVSDGVNPVSDGANLVSDGVNPVSDGANFVSEANNLVSDGHKPVSETKNRWFRPVFCQKSLILMKTAKCARRTRSAQRTLGLPSAICHLPSATLRAAFSLIEVMVVVALMSLIVLALMAVFNSTQRAFRSAVTQTDVLEGSRAAMDLIATDLRGLTPSDGVSNLAPPTISCPVNFFVLGNYNYSAGYQPLRQALPGTYPILYRTNLLNYFFVLSRQNTKWIGVGYVVDNTNSSPLYPLYRFYGETNIATSPLTLYDNFYTAVANSQWTNMSHLVDGVVHLTLHAYDPNGVWINRNSIPTYTNALNTYYLPVVYGEQQMFMLSNTVPAAVELEIGVLEDRSLARAESLPFNSTAQLKYLKEQSGTVHVFRQRVNIPNVDTTAYP